MRWTSFTVRQRQHSSDEVTPSFCGVFTATKWAVGSATRRECAWAALR